MKKIQNKKKKITKGSFISSHTGFCAFLIAFFCCAVIFGGIAFSVIHSVTPTAQTSSAPVTAVGSLSNSSAAQISSSESFTMLISVYSDSDGSPVQFMLYRLDAAKKRTVVLPVPLELSISSNGKVQSLPDIYKTGGCDGVRQALSSLMSIKIDYSCDISSANFIKIFDSLGGIYSGVPQNLSFVMPDDNSVVNLTASSKQYLSGAKIYALIASPAYTGGPIQRYNVQSALMKEFISEKMTGYYLDNAVTYYGNVFNLVDTNFTMNDLLNTEDALNAYSSSTSIVIPNPSYVASPSGKGLLQLTKSDTISNYFK
jgi:anionic cell wall polymer biosynthesis LytR-Cps2A-Psr (LCP) family protein